MSGHAPFVALRTRALLFRSGVTSANWRSRFLRLLWLLLFPALPVTVAHRMSPFLALMDNLSVLSARSIRAIAVLRLGYRESEKDIRRSNIEHNIPRIAVINVRCRKRSVNVPNAIRQSAVEPAPQSGESSSCQLSQHTRRVRSIFFFQDVFSIHPSPHQDQILEC